MNTRIFFFIALGLLLFSSAIFSQTIVPDTKLEGLKGKVKTVTEEIERVYGFPVYSDAPKRFKNLFSTYDEQGYLIEKVLGDNENKIVYENKDGKRSFLALPLNKYQDDHEQDKNKPLSEKYLTNLEAIQFNFEH